MAVILNIRPRALDAKGNQKPTPVRLILIHPEVGYELEIPLGEWQQLCRGGHDVIAQVKHSWEIDSGA